MTLAALVGESVATLEGMAKKKSDGGRHKTPRKPVQMPEDWLAVARQIAGNRKQPTLWYLITCIERDAREMGITPLPLLPWDLPPDNLKGRS